MSGVVTACSPPKDAVMVAATELAIEANATPCGRWWLVYHEHGFARATVLRGSGRPSWTYVNDLVRSRDGALWALVGQPPLSSTITQSMIYEPVTS